MNAQTKSEISPPDRISTSLNPKSDYFNFELWAREVRRQMLTAPRKPLNCRRKSSQARSSQAENKKVSG